ncbi:MAG: chromosome segregation protein SMC [Planctomycetes bacterium]|nr:chromosome segregation protein SMC [Planctomycetota bacterium]
MRLQRLELFGFKSFADRTTLSFERSFTGIVGPNGCGKSNVVDGIRWVLGETRPTSMRGGEMSDVIFKGSVSRPPMGVAEVTMVLDNSSGGIANQGAEVSITRRVFRTGEGEYLINGEKVRLKDVRDMLFDTGLGSRGYAVLEQGKIDAVLSANPLDRRAIFEEAAGVSRYRMRRKETDQKLKRVEADLLRLDDVLKELGSRVRSLKIQAGKAERYVAARDEWRTQRARYLKHRLHDGRLALHALQLAIQELEAKADGLRRLRSDEESDVQQREREQLTLAAEVDRLAAEIARLAGEGRAADERHAQLLARAQAWRASSSEEAQRALELASQLELREAELDKEQTRGRELDEQVSAARQRAELESIALRDARNEYRELRNRAEKQNQVVLGHLHERTAAHNTTRHLEQARPALAERAARARTRLDEGRREVEALRAEFASAEQRVGDAQNDLVRAETAVRDVGASLALLERDEGERRQAKAKREVERARLQSRIDTLKDLEHERASLESGARALLESVKKGQGPCSPQQLGGLVADHLRTSTRLARALDAALGPAALGLVTAEPELAAKLVRWLGDKKSGQVRLYLPAGLGARAERVREGQLGELPRLLDELECSEGFAPLARLLVGDVLVVESIEQGFELARAFPEWRFVTPGGDLVSAAGIFGGHREVTQGAVGRRAFAAELARELEKLSEEIREDGRELERLGAERKRAFELRAHAQGELERHRHHLGEVRAQGQTARARVADLERSLAVLEREADNVLKEEARLESEFDGASERLRQANEAFERENAVLSAQEAERKELELRLEDMQRDEARAQVELTRANTELNALRNRSRDLERGCAEAKVELERARRLARENSEAAESAVRDAANVRAEGDRVLVERGHAESRHEELRSAERAGREAVQTFRRRVDAVTREIELLSGALAERRLEAQKIELAASEYAVRAQEDLGLTEIQLMEDFEPETVLALQGALDELETEVHELKRKLDAIGPVNTDAVAELTESQGRFDFLTTQRKDLDESRRALSEALSHLNDESVRLFMETFEDVRGHFQLLFRQLFGGGKADLEMQQGVDPLEAGIEIVARPPGREMLPIGLLSGGQRTMTALALLFAVFRARPSPFCVLDEVDAALDDANVGRFLGMVDGFRQNSQFIVVTHNKGTMAACDRLYGITMETKGVSTWVSVQFTDVDRFVPEATGNAAEASRARGEMAADGADGERVVELTPQPRVVPAPEPDLELAPEASGVPQTVDESA